MPDTRKYEGERHAAVLAAFAAMQDMQTIRHARALLETLEVGHALDVDRICKELRDEELKLGDEAHTTLAEVFGEDAS